MFLIPLLTIVVFGQEEFKEPQYWIMLNRTEPVTYEVRHYNTRWAVEAEYETHDNSPFMKLAAYIGVEGEPENDKGTEIAMTVPVIMAIDGSGKKTMKFLLPEELNKPNKIPNPIDENIVIKEMLPTVGVVHKFSGSYDIDSSKEIFDQMVEQLRADGLSDMTSETPYEFWGYSKPLTSPELRRNEIWIELNHY